VPGTIVVGRHLNQQDRDGRPLCPVCEQPIRATQKPVDDGVFLRHGECRGGVVRAQWHGSIVRVHVRAHDWEDTAWRVNFEADLRRTGWRLLAVEPPSAEHPECVYILAPESERNPPGP
jgi:hypothetical protein